MDITIGTTIGPEGDESPEGAEGPGVRPAHGPAGRKANRDRLGLRANPDCRVSRVFKDYRARQAPR